MLFTDLVLNRIEEKKNILKSSEDKHSVCFVGHSQLDFWGIKKLAGYTVRNCGILAINAFEYYKYILENNLLDCDSEVFIFMFGANDLCNFENADDIAKDINKIISFISEKNPLSKLFFISCAHTNPDCNDPNNLSKPSNQKVDLLNKVLKESLPSNVTFINTDFLNDQNGNLALENTTDGLHFTSKAYKELEAAVTKAINQ